MTPKKAQVNPALSSALEAADKLTEGAFAELDNLSGLHAIAAHSEIKGTNIQQKRGVFYRCFLPFRAQMVALLANGYRMYFKLALAHRKQAGGDPSNWAWTELQPFVHAALAWMRDWYILGCDGESQRVRTIATVEFVPGQMVTTPITNSPIPIEPSANWRAPAWMFGVSLVFHGIDVIKNEHMPNLESEERLGPSHSRLLLKALDLARDMLPGQGNSKKEAALPSNVRAGLRQSLSWLGKMSNERLETRHVASKGKLLPRLSATESTDFIHDADLVIRGVVEKLTTIAAIVKQ